jgi:hypothetical protein
MRLLVKHDGRIGSDVPLLKYLSKGYGSILASSSDLGDFGQTVGVFEEVVVMAICHPLLIESIP